MRCLEVIGEAVKNIPDDLRNKYKDIPWRSMAGMRDKVIHSYFVVDFEMVWLTVTEEIPQIKPIIIDIINNLE